MSDEESTSPQEIPTEDPAKKPTRVRRISNRNPKKESPQADQAESISAPAPADEPDDQRDSEAAKRNKRRRRKPKAAEKTEASADVPEPEIPVIETTLPLVSPEASDMPPPLKPRIDEPKPRPQHQPSRPPNPPQQQQQQQRRRIDPDLLAKKAWKIFLAEVSEEGVALIGDNDARELTRRCFRLAELFLEEESRRR